MRKTGFILLLIVLVTGLSVLGCGKKQESLEQMQEPMSMESLSSMNAQGNTPANVPDPTPQALAPATTQAATESNLAPLPPAGPYKPSAKEIQTALKNAGFYTGSIDGNIGPKSKKAIEEFQKSKGLTADGKVGPKTWEQLSPYLQSSAMPSN